MELTPEERATVPHFDQVATLPASEQPLVLVYCKGCKSMKPKGEHNFSRDCTGEDETP